MEAANVYRMKVCLLLFFLLKANLSVGKLVTDIRLPRHALPELYDISLVPSFEENNFTLDGSVNILLNVLENANNITLHIRDIQVKEVKLENKTAGEVKIKNITEDKDREFLVIYTENELKKNSSYTLKIIYQGELNDKLVGFYRSSYKDEVGNTRWLGATQFQATDARRAFPCFDEPDLKAKFKVQIARLRCLNCISNMPIAKTTPMEGRSDWEVDHFEESVKMPTYLVAFVVSDFDFKDVSLPGETTFRIYARKQAIKSGEVDFAGEIGGKILKFLEEYYGVPYPLPKQDMIALPDFAAGAMENWGLITYRETALLFDKHISRASNKERIAVVVSHELAHMWFGNLVTPKWWNGLWLNEGFASYVEDLGVDHVKPDWKMKELSVSSNIHGSMKTDALLSSHPMSVKVNHPDEISEIFGRIIYYKGSAVIRMMSMFLTEETLRKGLSNYLNEFKFGNAEQDDLWRHLTEQAHKDKTLPSNVTVKEIMDTWTVQEGFPVINVQRNYETDSADVSQERFLLFKKENSTKSPLSWWVPLTHTSRSKRDFSTTKPSAWLRKGQKDIEIKNLGSKPEDWVIFNIQQGGYYRVNYDAANWKLLADQLNQNHSVIPALQRSQILNDALNLARTNRMDYSLALNLTSYLPKEKSYIPLKSGLGGLDYIWNMLIRTAGAADYVNYMKSIVYPLYKEVEAEEWESDGNYPDIQHVYWKIRVTRQACHLEHKGCITEAQKLFTKFMGNYTKETADQPEKQINPNLKPTVYCTAVKYGGENEWMFLWEHYKNTVISTEKDLVLRALGCSRSIWILSRYLDWILDDTSGIRKQDGSSVFGAVANNPLARCLVWDFLRSNWDKLKERYGDGISALKRIISSSSSNFNTKNEIDEMKDFQEKRKDDLGSATRTMTQAIEQAEANYQWMQNNYENVVQWFRENKPLKVTST